MSVRYNYIRRVDAVARITRARAARPLLFFAVACRANNCQIVERTEHVSNATLDPRCFRERSGPEGRRD